MVKYFFITVFLTCYLFGFSQTPNSYNGLQLWLKADDGPITSNSFVNKWEDKSGFNFTAVQNTNSLQPRIILDQLNGLPAIRFNGTSLLSGVKIPNLDTSSFTIFVLASGRAMSNFYSVLFNIGPYAYGGIWLSKHYDKFTIYSNNDVYSSSSACMNSNGFIPSVFAYSKKTNHLTRIHFNGNMENSSSAPPFINYIFNEKYNIGGDPSYTSTGYWDGDIYEIILYNRSLTPMERQQIEKYLFDKYSPPVDLLPLQKVCSFPYIIRAKKNHFTDYLWNDGSSKDSLIINAPGKYYVQIRDIFNRFSSDTIYIQQDNSTYSVHLGADTTLCKGNKLKIIGGPDHLTYLWQNNSSSHYLNVDTAGIYTVMIKDCLGNITKDTLKVTIQNPPAFSLGKDTTMCFNTLNVLTANLSNPHLYSFLWSDLSTNQNLTITHSDNYSLKVTDTKNCFYSDTIHVSIDSSLQQLTLGNDTSLCGGSSIRIKNSFQGLTYQWSDHSTNDSLIINSTGNYSIKVYNTYHCLIKDTIHVNILGQKPSVDFAYMNTCFKDTVNFTDNSLVNSGTSIIQWEWSFNDPISGSNNTSFLKNPQHSFSNTGTFKVMLKVVSSVGCYNSKERILKILPLPVSDFSLKAYCQNFPSVFFNNSASAIDPIIQYNWNFGDFSAGNLNTSSSKNTAHTYTSPGNYNAKLIVTTLNGCKDSLTKSLIIPSSTINNSSSLKLWLKTDKGVIVENNKIKKWEDQSGNNYHASQTNTSLQPSIQNNFLNNFPGISLDGNSILNGSTIPGLDTSSLSIFVLSSGEGMSDFYNILFNIGKYAYGGIWLSKHYDKYTLYSNNDIFSSTTPDLKSSGFIPRLFGLSKKKGNLAELITNGNVNNTSSLSPFVGNIFNDGYNIGGDPSYTAAHYWKGKIAEILVFNTSLSKEGRNAVENYIYNKYAPPINLNDSLVTCAFPITVNAHQNHFSSYLWSDGTAKDSIIITSAGKYSIETKDIFGRYSYDTIRIIKDSSNYQFNLGNDTTLCKGQSITLKAGPIHLNYTWQNNSHSNILKTDTSGVFKVNVTDCKGNMTKDTIKIIIQPLPIFSLGKDSTMCYNNTNFLKTNLSSLNNLSFIWNNGSSSSTLIITHSGIYSLKVNDIYNCNYTDTVVIRIDSSLYTTSLGPDTSICAGNIIKLKTGASQATSYLWSDNSTNPTLIVNTSGKYWLTVKNANNCIAKDTIQVTISGQAPNVNFNNSIACHKNIVQFTDASTVSGGSNLNQWQWNFGDPLSGANNMTNIHNPPHIFSDTGIYYVTLNVSSDVGCSQSKQIAVHVYPNPRPSFTYSLSCQKDSTDFSSNFITYGYPLSTIYWNFGDPFSSAANNTSSQNKPSHIFSQVGNFPVKLIATNTKGCKDSVSQTISVNPAITANFTSAGHCMKENIQFTDASIVPAPASQDIYRWIINGNNLSGKNVNFTFPQAGIYTIYHQVIALSGCESDTSMKIEIYSSPKPVFNCPNFCKKDTVQITEASIPFSGTLSTWKWQKDGLLFSQIQQPELTASDTGNHTIKLIVTNSFGCKDSLQKNFRVHPLPKTNFTYSPAQFIYPGTSLNLNSANTNGTFYWTVSTGQNFTIASPKVTFTDTGLYTIQLLFTDSNGCKQAKQLSVPVKARITDLGIINLSNTLNYTAYCETEALLVNFGSTPITYFELSLALNNSGSLKETWTGNLNPGLSLNFPFKSSLFAKNPEEFLCAEIINVNGQGIDENTGNNRYCAAVDLNSETSLNPFPNPVQQQFTLPLICNKEMKVRIVMTNVLGQQVLEKTYTLESPGLHFIQEDISQLSASGYSLQVMLPSKTLIYRLMKN